MSLDVYLEDPTATYEKKTLYWANITHNLGDMAREAGIYKALWRPEEIGCSIAEDISGIVREGLGKLNSDPDYYKGFDSPNGWGLYENFIPFVQDYLEALEKYPKAMIRVSR